MKYKIINFKIKLRIIIIIFLYSLFLELSSYYIKYTKFPKISVFLPIFNKEKYLIRSISCLQNQSLKNIEIIAINDGSTDNTLKILRKLSKKDNRIKIFNNDRNRGLLFSRAMGIIHSKGEYLMNLDPDDKLASSYNLEILYNKAKNSNLDYIKFLLKRIPRYRYEIELCEFKNKIQLLVEDFIITNKIIKKEILLKAYNYLYKEIYKNKWNYHEDNIWNILIIKLSKKKIILNKYIYIYKRNDNSLNVKKGSLMDIKNRIYRLKTLIKINEKNSFENYYNYYQYLQNIIKSCNSSILKDKEIKKGLIYISLKFVSIFKSNKYILNNINNNIINIISDNKIIIFFNSLNKNIIDYLTIFSIYSLFEKKKDRKIISIDINDMIKINNISMYIYPNDILFGLKDIIFHENFEKISNIFNKNEIIILKDNINFIIYIMAYIKPLYINKNSQTLYNNHLLFSKIKNNIFKNACNLSIYSFIQKFKTDIKNYQLFCLNMNITDLANYFNCNADNKDNNKLAILYDNYNTENIKKIKNISLKHYKNISIFKINSINRNIEDIIKKSDIIITDSIYAMELSVYFFTSCILYGNLTIYDEKIKNLLIHLNYIKSLNNINKLEKNLIELKNISSKYDMEKNYKKLELIINKII